MLGIKSFIRMMEENRKHLEAEKKASEEALSYYKKVTKEYNYDLDVKMLNEIFPDVEIVLEPETLNDIACNWRTCIVIYKKNGKSLEVNIFPYAGNDFIIKSTMKVLDADFRREMDNLKDQIKMTREEAIKKLVDAKVLHPNIGGTYILLDALEALGLIKFDKPEISIHEAIYLARGSVIGSQVDQNHFITYLKNLGYKIERI